jgi:pimeloyl-ACP methyl ester carboxylesterase
MSEELQIRVFGDATLPTLVYLPGLHGDWTLIASFRTALHNRVRFVEVTYPRTLTWTIDDYANAIAYRLSSHGINRAWLLAESFGSQPAWALLAQSPAFAPERGALLREGRRNTGPATASFQVDGLILAAGFVRHPLPHGPLILRWMGMVAPKILQRLTLRIIAWFFRVRRRRSPEALRDLKKFLARRTDLDRQAMRHRLQLISRYDPRQIARQNRIPVYCLGGFFDPMVPWPLVPGWLRENCPGYRAAKTIWLADHNVLASAPAASAAQVLKWMRTPQPKSSKPQSPRAPGSNNVAVSR